MLAAALATAPLFAFAEGFDARHCGRVALSNGGAALLCLLLLRVLRSGHAAAVGRALVLGLLLLVGALASTSGEEARFESIAQFLPSYAVIVLVLWLRARMEPASAYRGGALAPAAAPAPDRKVPGAES